ncbi:unnamed protein product [Penicillium pancosmium]
MSQNEPQNLPERPSEATSLLPPSEFNSDNPINPRIIAGIIATWIATFLAAADSTITSTLSATIAAEFDSLAIISWLGSGYLIGLTATQPLSGKLSDIFGRRASFCTAASLFTIGNLACGFAHSKFPLICARVITGIGGGGCISIATFIASDNIPLHRRGTWQGFSAVVYTTGMGLGAVIGGAINDAVGWRWAFIGIAPISLVPVVGVAMFVPKDEHVSSKGFRKLLLRVDFAVGLNHEGEQIVTRQFIIAIPLGIFLLVIFLLIEARWATEPIIPLSLFRQRTVVASCLTAWFLSMAFYALTFYVPLYMKQLGYSTSEIGVRLLPDSIGAGLGSFLVGLVIRVTGKYGIFRYTMPLLVVTAAAGFYWISMETPWVLPEIYLFFKGFGMGGALTMLILALLHAVPHEKHATATSALYAFRSTGSTMGLSAASAVVSSRLGQSSGGVSACAETEECYMHAIRGAFELALGCAFAGLVSALFIANYETRPKGAGVRDVDN